MADIEVTHDEAEDVIVPDVTVLIPTYNGADSIMDTVNSCYAGNDSITVEVIVGNDCSSDDTKSVLKENDVQNLTTRSRIGKGAILNRIWETATGRYVLVLAGMDTLEPGALSRLVNEFDEVVGIYDRTDLFLYGQTQYYGARNTLHKPAPFNARQFALVNPVCSVVIVHRDTVSERGLKYREGEEDVNGDWVYMQDLVAANFRGVPLQQTLVLHYQHYPEKRQFGDHA